MLRDNFEEKGKSCDISSIDAILKDPRKFRFRGYDLIGIGYPVYAFNTASLVYNFIKRLPCPQNRPTYPQKVFLFKTAGDSLCDAGSTWDLRQLSIRKGFSVVYEQLFVMPANIFMRYDDALMKQLDLSAGMNARIVVEDLLAGKQQLQKNPRWLRWFSRIFKRLEGEGAKYFGKDLRVSDACNNCGICVRNCPMQNISMENGKIQFGSDCLICMRCVTSCPKGAIEGHWYDFAIIKPFYDLQALRKDTRIESNFLKPSSNWYWRRLYRHITSKLRDRSTK